ncbi:MAG: hypothetical protein WA697_15925 [Pseudolabrys sp.]
MKSLAIILAILIGTASIATAHPDTSAIGTPKGIHTVSEPPMKRFTVWVDRVCEPYGVSPFDTETQAREYIKTYRSRLR